MINIEKYFAGEKWQCTIGALIAILSISIALYFLNQQKPVLKGISFVFIPLSLLLLAICVGVIIRTPKDIKRVAGFYTTEATKLTTEEIPRMEKVIKSFSIIKKVEIVFFVIGLLLFLFLDKNELIKGLAIGLMIQGVILYCFDYIAEYRAIPYLEFLRSIN